MRRSRLEAADPTFLQSSATAIASANEIETGAHAVVRIEMGG
jgi:hypothetical protein